MDRYIFDTTAAIAKAFDMHGGKYRVMYAEGSETLLAGFPVSGGPTAVMRFISRGDGGDVAVRIFALISGIPESKHAALVEACNELNRSIRYLKFCVDERGELDVVCDIPAGICEKCLGELAFELFIRSMYILDREYAPLADLLSCEDASMRQGACALSANIRRCSASK